MIISIIAIILTFGLVIFVHELGHFLMCKRNDIKVETFAFGFGPSIKKWHWGETQYQINIIPLGGFVKAAGDNLAEAKGKPREYFSKPWHARFMVAFSGPVMNYFLAFILFSVVIFFRGIPQYSKDTVIGELLENYPAYSAGLETKDKIIAINGQKITDWDEMSAAIHKNADKQIKIKYIRNEKENTLTLTPQKDPATGQGIIGISPVTEFRHIGIFKSAFAGAHQCYYWTVYSVVTLAKTIYQKKKPDIAGPIGIVHIISKTARRGVADLIFIVALISVAIGFFNLFPIPILDGGHMVLYLAEGISRKKLSEKVMAVANSVGILILLFIFMFATYNDIARIAKAKKEKAKVTQTQ